MYVRVVHARKTVRASGTDSFKFPWSNPRQGLSNGAEERPQILHAIGACPDDHDAERKCLQIVLVFKRAVHGEECRNVTCGAAKEFAVLDSGPTQSLDGHNLVAGQFHD